MLDGESSPKGPWMISKWWKKRWDWQDPMPDAEEGQVSQRDFEIEFFEGIVRRRGDCWEVLSVLGNHYTATKRHRDGLVVDRRLATLRPDDPVVFYNLACSYCLVGMMPSALKALERSLALGYRDFRHMMHDDDLDKLRRDSRFVSLMSKYVKV